MGGQAGKYARFELERRFLAAVPEGADDGAGWRITDRYLKHTQLRLRRMQPIHGGDAIFKFGQKQVRSPQDCRVMTITNLYLSASEYSLLAVLDAFELHKRRYPVEHGGRAYGIDVFDADLSGLVLAEVGFETIEEMNEPLDLPAWAIREVSNDPRFTGGALASLPAHQAAEFVKEIAAP